MLNTTKRYFLPLIVVAIATSLSSCSSSPTSRQNIASETPNSISSPSVSQTPSMAQLRAKSVNPEPLVTNKTTNITLYTSDVQCQVLVPQKVAVPAEEAVTGSVSKILEQRDSGDFSLSGYRVNVKNGTATVDFRVAPQSKRQLASLSSCEQFALFGSLRKTLTSNPQWKIKQVRFTQRGEDIEL
ncbi:GerMN domain-containing protein [Calothrix sp. PCC 7507]|uniref:GerMN domain-containing protein n=1 Tax=Calothrix sp. PCC 7507 TaxID=99598 RepID=UPI00029ED692|nr:GerMN domain-containing protein [Calothrix sp. PCC 7507]AFY36044.1 hypothetical protein Cal7507_5723 [Calothrix sp. PCC 7507]